MNNVAMHDAGNRFSHPNGAGKEAFGFVSLVNGNINHEPDVVTSGDTEF